MALHNLARMSTATTGTGAITLGSAISGFLSFSSSGVIDGETVSYGISDGANSEVGTGVYTASGTTLTRSPTTSTNGNAAISLSGTAQVFITPRKEDLLVPANNLSDVASASTALSNLGGAAKSANLSDLANATTARTNLGLGNAATKNVGTTAGTVAAGDDSRFAVPGTWTPTIGSATGTIGSATGSGTYTKIGNKVDWALTVSIGSIGSAGGFISFTNPPGLNPTASYSGYGREAGATGYTPSVQVNPSGSGPSFFQRYDGTFLGANGYSILLGGTYYV